MKRYIKQKVFSWKDRLTVKDEEGRDLYCAEGEVFSWGHRLHVCDAQRREMIYIQEKVMSWKPRYYIYIDGREAAEIVREFSFFRPQYTISGLDWEIKGSFWEHEYDVLDRKTGARVASIQKEWMTWGDSYEVSFEREEDEKMLLALVLTIDCVMASEAASAATAPGSV